MWRLCPTCATSPSYRFARSTASARRERTLLTFAVDGAVYTVSHVPPPGGELASTGSVHIAGISHAHVLERFHARHHAPRRHMHLAHHHAHEHRMHDFCEGCVCAAEEREGREVMARSALRARMSLGHLVHGSRGPGRR